MRNTKEAVIINCNDWSKYSNKIHWLKVKRIRSTSLNVQTMYKQEACSRCYIVINKFVIKSWRRWRGELKLTTNCFGLRFWTIIIIAVENENHRVVYHNRRFKFIALFVKIKLSYSFQLRGKWQGLCKVKNIFFLV